MVDSAHRVLQVAEWAAVQKKVEALQVAATYLPPIRYPCVPSK